MQTVGHVFERCWCCATLVGVPLDDSGRPSELFKCGWCGAINALHQQQVLWQHTLDELQRHGQAPPQLQPQQPQAPPPQLQHALRTHARRCLACGLRGVRWLAILLVLLLVGSIAGLGIMVLLPRLCLTWATYVPNLGLALGLTLQVLFNYAAAVAAPAGSVADCVPQPARGPDGRPLPGSCDLWTYCSRCRGPKPPRTHHCRACGACVVDMDHHCPFINNCVGSGNLRSFLLFLIWTLLAVCYILFMCGLLIARNWPLLQRSMQQYAAPAAGSDDGPSSARGPGGGAAGPAAAAAAVGARPQPRQQRPPEFWLIASSGAFILLLQASPWWMLAAFYLVAVSTAVLLALGLLLASQLHYLARGVSFVQALKHGSAATSEAAGPAAGARGAPTVRPGGLAAAAGVTRRAWRQLGVVLRAGGTASEGQHILRAALALRWRPPVLGGSGKKAT